jgi:hypothetical protein
MAVLQAIRAIGGPTSAVVVRVRPLVAAGFCCVASAGHAQLLTQTDAELLRAVPVTRLVTTDLNGDDRMDVVALRFAPGPPEQGGNSVIVQRQFADGVLRITQVLPAELPVDIALADMDSDGDLDVLVAEDSNTAAIRIWVNQGGLQPGPAGYFQAAGGSPANDDLAAGLCILRNPVSGRRQDLLLARGVGRESIWLEAQTAPPGVVVPLLERQRFAHPGAVGALCADFDGDGLDDVLIYGSSTELWLRRIDAETAFVASSAGPVPVSGTVFAASTRDLDGDGQLDLLLATGTGDFVLQQQGLNGNGDPLYTQVDQLDGVGGTLAYQWMDVDDDGDHDLIAVRESVNAPLAMRGSAVFLRQGLVFEAAPVQRLAPARSGAVAALGTGLAPVLWLASLAPGNNGIWATGVPGPPPQVRFSARLVGAPQAHYLAGTVGAFLDVLPQTVQPFSASLQAFELPSGSPQVAWSVDLQAGQRSIRTRRNSPLGSSTAWQVDLTAITPAAAAQIGSPASTIIGIYHNPFANLDTLRCYLLCVGLGQCNNSQRAGEGSSGGQGSGGVQLFMASMAEISLLQRLRDERMASSAGGQYYIDLYDDLSLDLYGATFVDPGFYRELWDLKDAWMPAVGNLVDGDGQMPVSEDMQARLQAALLRFQSDGSPALREAIEVERRALDLDRISGRPISWLQQRWETTPLLIDDFEDLGEAR